MQASALTQPRLLVRLAVGGWKKGAAGCKNGPADSPRAMRASLDTLSGLHNHEP